MVVYYLVMSISSLFHLTLCFSKSAPRIPPENPGRNLLFLFILKLPNFPKKTFFMFSSYFFQKYSNMCENRAFAGFDKNFYWFLYSNNVIWWFIFYLLVYYSRKLLYIKDFLYPKNSFSIVYLFLCTVFMHNFSLFETLLKYFLCCNTPINIV